MTFVFRLSHLYRPNYHVNVQDIAESVPLVKKFSISDVFCSSSSGYAATTSESSKKSFGSKLNLSSSGTTLQWVKGEIKNS